MSGYVYDLPTTGALSLSELCTDITGSHASNLARATEARANVRAILKASRRTDAGERDYLKVVKALDEYTPFVNAIIASVAADDLTLAQEPIFSWRSTLSHSTLSDPPRINVHGLHAELAFVLHSSAYALSNLAAASVASLGTYERDRALPDADRRAKDEKLTFAVKLLCRAAGIFTHIAQVVIPELGKGTGGPRPPELREDVANALAKLALADAHALSVRKLLTRSAVQAALSPGPPLPQGHPPPAFVAKIYLYTASLYASARGMTDTSQRKLSLLKSRGGADNAEVSQDTRRYLEDETALTEALAHKWLGVDAGEAGRTGDAAGYLKWAKSELESLKEGKLARFKKSGGVDGKMKKERSVEELESIGMFLNNYLKVNDSINFQPVPTSSTLQSTIPAGMSVVTEKPYEAPMPAFGPGTPDYVARHVQKPDPDTTTSPPSEPKEDDRDYGLKGSYF
ncbi:pH-response regulator protein palC [Yarrowia lipolytica CLIB122] [Rhizoctonia solani]|uniref:pH-response regulator protein palC n=1 Tax=Rhizoctonia solani TaxID=456999 RepID=A0A0K6FKZ2_9AGAM|nr:pH-response regulator protein palC [Yarrowia lipolytica CLIB122] [Rhizoctonia solani]